MASNTGGTLPPLPASDERSLQWNTKDSFYDVKVRDFWGKNQVTREEIKDFKKCEHYFVHKGPDIECKKCHFGLLGLFEVQDGKIIHQGKPVEF